MRLLKALGITAAIFSTLMITGVIMGRYPQVFVPMLVLVSFCVVANGVYEGLSK